jgi:nucleotide-binding universal stress UspA family protein
MNGKPDSPGEEGRAAMDTTEAPGSRPALRIVHPTDFSVASDVAFGHALKLALVTGAELDLLHVSRQRNQIGWEAFPGVRAMLERWGIPQPDRASAPPGRGGLRVGKIVGVDTDPVRSVIDYVGGHPTDLVVLATHQRNGIERWLHAATAEPIARRSHEMTLFIPLGARGFVSTETGEVTLRRILVPVDRAPAPQPAVDATAALLRGVGCAESSIVLLHVGAEANLPAVKTPLGGGCRWEWAVRAGGAVDGILHVAAGMAAELIVMTTQGHRGLVDALRGSTTECVIRRARCPVLAVPEGSRAMVRLFFR